MEALHKQSSLTINNLAGGIGNALNPVSASAGSDSSRAAPSAFAAAAVLLLQLFLTSADSRQLATS